MERRTFLTTAATGVAATVAGCSSITNRFTDSSLPDYHTAIPAENLSGDAQTFGYLNWNRVLELNTFSESTETTTPTPTPDGEDSEQSPASGLVAGPVVGSAFTVAFALGFGLASYGDFGTKVSDDMDIENFNIDPSESAVDAALYHSDGLVLYGSFDSEDYNGDALPDGFSETETRDGFTVYSNTGSDGVPTAAISDDRLVFTFASGQDGPTGAESMTRTLNTMAGDADRFADRSADAEWALKNAANHTFVIGGVTRDSSSDDSDYNPAVGALQEVDAEVSIAGASVDSSDGELTGANADYALFHTGDPVDSGAVEDAYTEGGDGSVDVSVSTSSGDGEGVERVHVSGSFSDGPNLQTPQN